MKKKNLLWLFLLISPSIYCTPYDRAISLNVGPTLQYTRYKQGELPNQQGFMAGPAFDFRLSKPWHSFLYVGFKGLWDVPHLCSDNGLIIDSNEYELNLHLGYQIKPEEQRFSFIPFVGLDFIHLSHKVKDEIIGSRYFQINIPIGLQFLFEHSDRFDWGFKGYYDIDVWTRLKMSTPDLCDTKDCKIELERSHRFQISGIFEWHFRLEKHVGIDLTYMPLFTWQRFGTDKVCDPKCFSECSTTTPLNIPKLTQWHLGSICTFGISF